MAEGYARASGRTGVVLVPGGPVLTNTIKGLVDALMDSIPGLVIAGQVGRDRMGTNAFQESNTMALTRAATKWSRSVVDAGDVASTITEALLRARTGRPGPVPVELPKDCTGRSGRAVPTQPINRSRAAPESRKSRCMEDGSAIAGPRATPTSRRWRAPTAGTPSPRSTPRYKPWFPTKVRRCCTSRCPQMRTAIRCCRLEPRTMRCCSPTRGLIRVVVQSRRPTIKHRGHTPGLSRFRPSSRAIRTVVGRVHGPRPPASCLRLDMRIVVGGPRFPLIRALRPLGGRVRCARVSTNAR